MKKLVFLISFFLCGLSAIFADEYVVSNFKYLSDDGRYVCDLTFKYDDAENVYYLYRSSYSSVYWFTLTPAKLEKLRANLEKAQEWSKLARTNKSSITKDLPSSAISVEGTMNRGNDWYSTRWNIDLSFLFISKFNDDEGLITLYVRGGESEAKQNQFVDIEFESMILLDYMIDDFADAISVKTVEEAKKKHQQEKAAADMFN